MLLTRSSAVTSAKDTEVEFRVRVPSDTSAVAKVYIAGSLKSVGGWKPDGLLLKQSGDRIFAGKASLPIGETLEYKVTLGTWQRVEKGKGGTEIANRRLKVEPGTVAEIAVESWAQGNAPRPKPSLTGTVRFHPAFASRILANERTLAVYLPPGYDTTPAARYPVLYLHDGQNVFDVATSAFGVEWGADETAERLIRAGGIRPVILVAIANTGRRADEYTAHRDGRFLAGGHGNDYARFLVEEVKPFIDSHYRTLTDREHTGVAGSSLGGLSSLQIATTYPQTFGLCGVISPAFAWADEQALKEFEQGDRARWSRTRFWVDMGTREGARGDTPSPELPRTRRFAARLKSAGLKDGRDYRYIEVEGGEHNEAAWAARFGDVLRFFFPKNDDSDKLRR